jgi:hypothetical protein
MEDGNVLNVLKQSFEDIVPQEDARAVLSPMNLVVGLAFCFMGDTKSFSIESLRRFIITNFKIKISKGAFWERLSNERLKKILKLLIAELIAKLAGTIMLGADILLQLNVTGILLIDSSSITLWDGAKKSFPGTRTHAGIKWHACFDLLSGVMVWFETTSTSVHDRKCFPEVAKLVGKLIIFDLGYWDYGLMIMIDDVKGFFLSRIKSNSAIMIIKVIQGMPKSNAGKKLSALKDNKKSGNIIELLCAITFNKITRNFRAIGFWNPKEKKYHWYVTNLMAPAAIIYLLYRIRWQIELIFKGCKRSLNLDQKQMSNNDNIIESLVLSTIVACLASHVVFNIGIKELSEEERMAISFQRIHFIAVLLAKDFINFLTNRSKKFFTTLLNQIKLLSCEIFEKNYNKRHTTLKKLSESFMKSS